MLSLPNLLTLSRILAVPILVFLLWRPAPIDYAITFGLYCLVGLTDYFDGYVARAWGRHRLLVGGCRADLDERLQLFAHRPPAYGMIVGATTLIDFPIITDELKLFPQRRRGL